MTKKCPKCQTNKPTTAFGKNQSKKDGLQNYCKECRAQLSPTQREADQKRYREWHTKNKRRASENGRSHYRKNKDKIKAQAAEWRMQNPEQKRINDKHWRKANPLKKKYNGVKARAKQRGQVFDLPFDRFVQLHQTTYCPVCSIKMVDKGPRNNPTNKSIDRIDSSQGYSKDNCTCICYRCNVIKGFATAKEHIMIANWLREVAPPPPPSDR